MSTKIKNVFAIILIVIVVMVTFSIILPEGLGALGVFLALLFIGWAISQM